MPKQGKKLSVKWKKILLGAMAASTIAVAGFTFKTLPYFIGEKVIEVVDGDTFQLANKQNVRLYGLDAPEPENCLGQEAKQALEALIFGKKVILREPIVINGRPICLVYQDNIFVNEVMLRLGLAIYDRHGQSETARLKEASNYAKENQVGVYSVKCTELKPSDQKCTIKGNIDPERNLKEYYQADCRFYPLVIIQKYEGDRWFCTEKEAKDSGFVPASSCR